MRKPLRIIVLHTAFLGDIILALPMVQTLKRSIPDGRISFLAVPASAAVLANHPSIDDVILYDKKGAERGIRGITKAVGRLKRDRFDVAIIPHRSLRSALLPWIAGIPVRIGFSTSAGRFLMTARVAYNPDRHEIMRNLDLLRPLGIAATMELPGLYPSASDVGVVEALLRESFSQKGADQPLVAIAPGSVWETKRWPEEKYTALTKLLSDRGFRIALIGGDQDNRLAERISRGGDPGRVLNAAGKLSMLQSAELIRRSAILVSNDSAPMHAGVAMKTPVLALFGATVPRFGFAPAGSGDRVLQTEGLECRPCSIHGGRKCPIGTFDCMQRIAPTEVFETILEMLGMSLPLARGH